MYKVFGLGHRFLENENQVRENIRASLDYFISIHGQIECISNLACGADTIFIQEAINKKCKIQLILPFQINEYEKDFDSESLILFRSIISNHAYSVHGDLKSSDDVERDLAYQSVGRSNIEECDAILAVWDGEIGKGLGGTKDHVDYAIELNKNIHWIKSLRKSDDQEITSESQHTKEAAFKIEDKAAIKLKVIYKRSWSVGIILGLITIFLIELNFIESFSFTFSSLLYLILSLLVLISFFSAYYLIKFKANKLKNKFIEHRLKAEKLRAQLWKDSLDFSFAPDLFKNETSILHLFNDSKRRQLWIHINEQIIYQKTSRYINFNKKLGRYELLLNLLRYTFLFLLVGLFLYHTLAYFNENYVEKFSFIKNIFGFIWMAIPPLYASIEGVIHFNDWKKNKKISLELINLYESILIELNEQSNYNELLIIEEKIVGAFTFEIAQWYNEEKNKNLELKI
jgi:hypothetical protein